MTDLKMQSSTFDGVREELSSDNTLRFNIRENPHSDTLIVTLSWNKRLTMGSINFPYLVIDIADLLETYYVLNADTIIRAVGNFIKSEDIKNVCFIGASKGGFGSLLMSRELSAIFPEVKFSCLAFSPQTRIWPRNEGLTFRSYRALLETREQNEEIAGKLDKYGDLRSDLSRANLKCLIFFGIKNKQDTKEAFSMSGSSILHEPVNISAHGSLNPFICSSEDPQGAREIIRALSRNAKRDADLRQELDKINEDKILAEIFDLPPRPHVLTYLDWILRRHTEAKDIVMASRDI